ncbi:mitochondrial protein, implicated in respiratory complex assembly [Schizosaccharomyces pombe]|uniref:NADH dehydrogenase [ubiquinone] 1 alpha subcomplex subunit 4 homolog n=1 Tax=Schizosaccharomyces pombe (strain 972 / ATCC 24843) TaxID=284812 RepID=NDUA4_SCHPO|nr:putative NADH:ubiquinone reductase complex subunit [Schizosaccharomyces pombe]G2TRT6.1 RecName: Full=NADH dehydrogenase [ubiquinone] 1 alpha subcomplex subunit 4 homolog [Schizosaccharomyces pombe 972h-]CCD31398.1 NADH-ubiquinone reductase complex subunit (predicted) [Schizosaccharomyces pombe]|eukprot:NP_001343188.1 putative NADH:ubiquinone reductase complex subunit [Schizosaccharomyces pombe]
MPFRAALRKVPVELYPLGAAVATAVGFATYSMGKKLLADPNVHIDPTVRRTI